MLFRSLTAGEPAGETALAVSPDPTDLFAVGGSLVTDALDGQDVFHTFAAPVRAPVVASTDTFLGLSNGATTIATAGVFEFTLVVA